MDRNLGATQVATAFNDAASYGDLYQWGRAGDGHQLRTSGNQTTLATTPVPSLGNVWDGLFIVVAAVSPWNWLATPSDNLWQGVNGTNNPCPTGMRIPTQAEWECERADFINTGGNNRTGAFGSALALPSGGHREGTTGGINFVGNYGDYWSSTVSGVDAIWLAFTATNAVTPADHRAVGASIRCIKD
jgi:hypothetical protein